ncbi:MAG TPA: helix-turn-helix domain-containing protein [Rhizomicrobium sp.]|jgi:CRP-like cAMP-binding protein|nr:helix-turn-helix domain-containing protein [Rhizomicrobium sp.]
MLKVPYRSPPQSHEYIRSSDGDALHAMEPLATTRTCRCGQQIFGADDVRQDWYRVVSGAARNYLLLADGRRRIVDFFLAGDYFGFGSRNANHLTVEAAREGTVIACYPRRQVEALADSSPALGRGIREVAVEAVSRSHARMFILGRVTAVEKVMAFLAEMAVRSSELDHTVVVLQMSRYDIADYLALSVETVCRALTELQHRGAIALQAKRRIQITARARVH